MQFIIFLVLMVEAGEFYFATNTQPCVTPSHAAICRFPGFAAQARNLPPRV
jgi:hypothetical protein